MLRVELSSPEYRIDENDGPLEVCARLVPPGMLQRPLEVTLSTRPDTAIGHTLIHLKKHKSLLKGTKFHPSHKIYLSIFALDKTTVTVSLLTMAYI